MTEKIVALDIGSSHLRGIEATIANGIPRILKIAEIPIDSHIVQNGEILAPEALVVALGRLWKEGKFENKNVLTLASGSTIINRVVDALPWSKPEDFKKLLPYLVRDHVPFEIDEYYLDSHTLAEYKQPGDDVNVYKAVLLTGVNKDYVDSLVRILEANRFIPRGIDSLPLSLIRAHNFSEEYTPGQIVASIELGADTTTIVMHQDHQPIYLHSAPGLGADRITDRLALELQLERPKAEFLKIALSLNEEERETYTKTFLKEKGQVQSVQFSDFSEQDIQNANYIISQEVSNLIAHINDILEDSYTEPDSKVNVISLTGGGAKLNTLRQRLSNELSIDVKLATPFGEERSKKIADYVFDNQHAFSAVFGLLLGHNG